MANDELPNDFDVIVLGTGLPESIIAGACARSGLSVLHLDRNDFYGGEWASFNLRSLIEWADEAQNVHSQVDSVDSVEQFDQFLLEGETALLVPLQSHVIANIRYQWHIGSERTQDINESEPESTEESAADAASEELTATKDLSVVEEIGECKKRKVMQDDSRERWTRTAIEDDQWRRFSLDLSPKVLLARGPLVSILCRSEVARYAEFKSVDQLLCLSDNGLLSRVPSSRSQIFQSTALSMVEKRKLMKFLTFAINWANEPEQYQEYLGRAFGEYLLAKGLSRSVSNYLEDAIGILKEDTSTMASLQAISRFLTSVGRFGHSPFLWPIYGSGELPQCFCRLSAVFGGIYCLRRAVHAILLRHNTVTAIVTEGQRISCRHLIGHVSYVPKELLQDKIPNRNVQRAILLTDRPLMADDANDNHITLLNLSKDDPDSAVHLIETGAGGYVAPKGLFVCHLTGKSRVSACEALEPIVRRHFIVDGDETEKPKLLFSLYFDIKEALQTVHDIPVNFGVFSSPDSSLDYQSVIEPCQKLFEQLWPDRDFLPSMPRSDADQGHVPPDDPPDVHAPVISQQAPTL